MAVITLYHGSNVVVENPRLVRSDTPKDYGSGFYCTTDRDQAVAWVRKKTFYGDRGYVNVYRFNSEELQVLKVLEFRKADEAWADFVEKNRRQRTFTHDYDIVIGPVADDRVNRSFSLYEQGIITKPELISRLETYRLVNQFLFHTENALRYLSFVQAQAVILLKENTLSRGPRR